HALADELDPVDVRLPRSDDEVQRAGLGGDIVGQVDVVVAPGLPPARRDRHRADGRPVRCPGADVDGAAGLGGPPHPDPVDVGEVGRVEGEPVVHLGEADVLAPADVLRLLDLDTGATTARRAEI